jgi:hypothetical protein
MATTTPGSLADGQLANAQGDLYTVPGATAGVGVIVYLHNTNASAEGVYLFLQRSGGTSRQIMAFQIDAGGSAYARITALSTGDKIRGYADDASQVNYEIVGGTQ